MSEKNSSENREQPQLYNRPPQVSNREYQTNPQSAEATDRSQEAWYKRNNAHRLKASETPLEEQNIQEGLRQAEDYANRFDLPDTGVDMQARRLIQETTYVVNNPNDPRRVARPTQGDLEKAWRNKGGPPQPTDHIEKHFGISTEEMSTEKNVDKVMPKPAAEKTSEPSSRRKILVPAPRRK